MLQKTIYVLAVQDLERSAEFYRDALGFTVHDMGDPGWLMFSLGNCRVMAGHCPDELSAADLGNHSYFAYWVTDDVDSYYEQVLANGVDLIKDLRDEPWGMREFGIRTIDGHRIMIGQDLEV